MQSSEICLNEKNVEAFGVSRLACFCQPSSVYTLSEDCYSFLSFFIKAFVVLLRLCTSAPFGGQSRIWQSVSVFDILLRFTSIHIQLRGSRRSSMVCLSYCAKPRPHCVHGSFCTACLDSHTHWSWTKLGY